jgi:hypothetical protein
MSDQHKFVDPEPELTQQQNPEQHSLFVRHKIDVAPLRPDYDSNRLR